MDDGKESPLWAFLRSRALNRLALRTKLNVTTATVERADPLSDYTVYRNSNCYHAPHGGVALPRTGKWLENQTAASCAALCTADDRCDCVTYQARPGAAAQHKAQFQCWPRADCEPAKFEHDNLTLCYVYVKKKAPAPPPSASGGAIAYLKHDALGPTGDAAVTIFNPGAAQTLTLDLSLLPPALLASKVVPVDLFTNASASAPLAAKWTVAMKAGSFAAFGFRGLGVFAPRKGKFQGCNPSDGHSKPSPATTLQDCFLDCKRDASCENVFVTMKELPRWLEKPGPIACTLLGAVDSTSTACPKKGAGTLVRKLDARPQARPSPLKHDDDDLASLACHLNGKLGADGSCECFHPSWTGSTCGRLNLQPVHATQMGYANRSRTSWGGNSVFEGGLWHMFVSEIAHGCSLNYWTQNSQIIHAQARDAAGPYTKRSVALPPWSHEAQLVVNHDPSAAAEKFVLFHVGLGLPVKPPAVCKNTSRGEDRHSPVLGASGGSTVHTAATLDGPWTPVPGWLASSTQPCTNPAPLLLKNGTWLLRCIGGDMHRAEKLAGPWSSVHQNNPPAGAGVPGSYEDPVLFIDPRGNWHVIWHVCERRNPRARLLRNSPALTHVCACCCRQRHHAVRSVRFANRIWPPLQPRRHQLACFRRGALPQPL